MRSRDALDAIEALRPTLRDVIARYDVSRPRIIGSVARGTATATSDIDLLVMPGRRFSLIALQRLQEELGHVVGRPVDIVAEDAVPDDVLARMLVEALPL